LRMYTAESTSPAASRMERALPLFAMNLVWEITS
jgi:hypothetical protein